MGPHVETAVEQRTDFHWVSTDEPHATRRKQILEKHPEIRSLYGPDKDTLKFVLILFAVQLVLGALLIGRPLWVVILAAYTIGATLNHSLNMAVHELSHRLCFKTARYNTYLAVLANLPTALPTAVTFRKYHLEHHMKQGVDGIDTDIPTPAEGRFFTTTARKIVWVFCLPLFYTLRPLLTKPKPMTMEEFWNWAVVLAWDVSVAYFAGYEVLLYYFLGTWFGNGLHPLAFHLIGEHFEFTPGYETYSYYGGFNKILLNVGYHNEHHDFPHIPGSRLHRVRAIAPEFYNNLPSYTSWWQPMVRFMFDPAVTPFFRVMRKDKTLAPENKLD